MIKGRPPAPLSPLPLALLVALAVIAVAAGDVTPPVPSAKADDNPLSFADGAAVFDAEWRLRLEWRDNDRDFDRRAASLQDTEALLSRLRLGLTLRPQPWLRLYLQGQDARETLSDRGRLPGVNSAQGNAEFDLRQGFVALGDYERLPLGATLGRQALHYGDGRLIADPGWGNFGRSFDGARLRWQQEKWWAEAFAASVVETERGAFDRHKDDEYVSGAYLSSRHLAGHTLDCYGFYFDIDEGGAAGRYTAAGARLAAAKAPERIWDYTLEAITQHGVRPGKNGTLDIAAAALHADVGYTLKDAPWRPRIGLSYDYASGDDNPDDGDSTTFRTPYTSCHNWYGRQDIIGLANIHNPRLTIAAAPTKKLALALEYNHFWLADNSDYAYAGNGLAPVRRTTPDGRDVRRIGASGRFGQELDFIADYALNANLKLHGGVSWFGAGPYLAQTGADNSGLFLYFQATVRF